MAPQWKRPEPTQGIPALANQRTVLSSDAQRVKASDPKFGARVERVIPQADQIRLGENVVRWRGVLTDIKTKPGCVSYGIVKCDDGQTREIRITALRYENES